MATSAPSWRRKSAIGGILAALPLGAAARGGDAAEALLDEPDAPAHGLDRASMPASLARRCAQLRLRGSGRRTDRRGRCRRRGRRPARWPARCRRRRTRRTGRTAGVARPLIAMRVSATALSRNVAASLDGMLSPIPPRSRRRVGKPRSARRRASTTCRRCGPMRWRTPAFRSHHRGRRGRRRLRDDADELLVGAEPAHHLTDSLAAHRALVGCWHVAARL